MENARSVQEAQKEVARAQKDAAQVAKDAARQVAEAQAEAARAVRDASRDVIEAEKAVRDARQEAARDTRDANESVLESWAKLRGDAQLTTEQLLSELEKQVKDQEQWRKNLVDLAGRVPPEMLDELAELGPGGAQVVALATQMSDVELRKFIALHGRSGQEAGEVFAKNLADAAPVLQDIARTRGQEVADMVRKGMDGGRQSVYEAARQLGLEIDNGIGKDRTIRITIEEQLIVNRRTEEARNSANGNIFLADGGVTRFANGSEHHIAQLASPGMVRVWAEPETGGEAYIPLAMSKRGRSEDILSEVASRFGGTYLRAMPVGPWAGVASAASGGATRPTAIYNITVNGGLDGGAEIGSRVVNAIQEYERRSGSTWRRSL